MNKFTRGRIQKIDYTHFYMLHMCNVSKKNQDDTSRTLFTLSLSILILNSQCKEGAKYVIFVEMLYFKI